MSKVKLMTQAEYATHRGISGAAVSKAVASGRISLIDGKIDPAVADIQWAQNTRARADSKRPDGQAPATPGAEGGSQPSAEGDYWNARSRRETAEAAIAEMKEQEMRGALIRSDVIRTVLATKISATRDALLQIPVRLAPVLAAESDIERVAELLDEELRQALAQLSEAKVMEGAA